MAPCSVTAAPSPSSPRTLDNAPDTTPPPPLSETRNTVDLLPRARSYHRHRLASAHSPSKSVSGFLASAEPTASAFCPARRSRVGRPDTPANPVPCSSPPLSSCRVYPESPKIKTPISAGGVTVSRSEPELLGVLTVTFVFSVSALQMAAAQASGSQPSSSTPSQ